MTSARDLAVLSLYIRAELSAISADLRHRDGDARQASSNRTTSCWSSFAGTTGMKTGYVCASGLNMVATVERDGRKLLAVVLGGSSARERNERAAELMLKGFSGAAQPNGQNVLALGNSPGATPVDMRPLICGKDAKAYVATQEAAFPMGMKGQPSYLNDTVRAQHLYGDRPGPHRRRGEPAAPTPDPFAGFHRAGGGSVLGGGFATGGSGCERWGTVPAATAGFIQ